MRPIMQTRTGGDIDAPGNCFPACIASIFEVDLAEVPDEAEIIAQRKAEGRWEGPDNAKRAGSWSDLWVAISDWLLARFGVGMLEIDYATGTGGLIHDDETYCILGGPSPRGLPHAVVGRGAEIVHDPHPEGGGLAGDPETVTYFVAANPVRNG